METFVLPVRWRVFGYVEVEGNSIEEAIEKFYKDNVALPQDGEYVDDSIHLALGTGSSVDKAKRFNELYGKTKLSNRSED